MRKLLPKRQSPQDALDPTRRHTRSISHVLGRRVLGSSNCAGGRPRERRRVYHGAIVANRSVSHGQATKSTRDGKDGSTIVLAPSERDNPRGHQIIQYIAGERRRRQILRFRLGSPDPGELSSVYVKPTLVFPTSLWSWEMGGAEHAG